MPALGTHSGACPSREWILYCMDPIWQGKNCWAAWILYCKDPIWHGKAPASPLECTQVGRDRHRGCEGSER